MSGKMNWFEENKIISATPESLMFLHPGLYSSALFKSEINILFHLYYAFFIKMRVISLMLTLYCWSNKFMIESKLGFKPKLRFLILP